MRLQKVYGLGLGATLSLALIACGGGPDIDQVKADFENPSGSTKDKNAVISASSQAGASSSVRILGAAGVPGQGLTAKGKLRAFSELSMIERYAPFAERELYRLTKNETRALRTSDFIDSCDAAAFEEASQELQNELGLDLAFGGSSASADARSEEHTSELQSLE